MFNELLDVYGITFATGQAAITPASDAVLNDVLAVLTANMEWRLRIEGHANNVGDKAANLKLSTARAAADGEGHRGRPCPQSPRGPDQDVAAAVGRAGWLLWFVRPFVR